MPLQPLGDRVLVKPQAEKETSAAGIMLPESKEKKSQGEIIAIGTGEKIQKLNLKVGDVVMFGKYAGEEVELEKIEYKILKEEDVLAIIK